MKKEFVAPNVEHIQFEENSVIETSGGYRDNGNHDEHFYGDNLPGRSH